MANILIIYGHPETQASFNFDLKERLAAVLAGQGHVVAVRDLYALGFDPLLSAGDMASFRGKAVPADIKAEQDFIAAADIMVFVYPVWWAGPPAMVKGYLDRVFSSGFAYAFRGGKKIGLLSGRKAVVVNSNGNAEEEYKDRGFYAAMEKIMDEGTLRYAGFDDVIHLFYGGMAEKSREEKDACIADAVDKVLRFVG
jgi:NAD(P)H dehydrogenase (quinone)